jgi:hypothetical protein
MKVWKTSYGTVTITPNPRSKGWTVKIDGVAMFRAPRESRALDYVVAVYGVTLTPKEQVEGLAKKEEL